jgi:hypothetical protein
MQLFVASLSVSLNLYNSIAGKAQMNEKTIGNHDKRLNYLDGLPPAG